MDQKWEYELFSTADVPAAGFLKATTREDIRNHLNALGAEGWEVVNAQFALQGGRTFTFDALLKRPKSG